MIEDHRPIQSNESNRHRNHNLSGDSSKSTIVSIGGDVVKIVGIFGTAFSIFQGLDAFLSFCSWVRSLMAYWDPIVHLLWDVIGRFFNIRIPDYLETFLTTWLFFVVTLFTSMKRRGTSHKVEEETSVLNRVLKNLVRTGRSVFNTLAGVVLLIIVLVATSWKHAKKIAAFVGNVSAFENVLFWAFLAPFLPMTVFREVWGVDLDMMLLARRCIRILIVVFFLVGINYIGLYADSKYSLV